MDKWYREYGTLLFKISPKAYAIYELYKHKDCIYNGEMTLANELEISPRTLKRVNIVLQDFGLIDINNFTGMCKMNESPNIDVDKICKKYNISFTSKYKTEDMFDANVLAKIRQSIDGKKIRIETVGSYLGISKVDIERIKNDKQLNKRYKDALEESLYIFKGTTRQEEFTKRLKEWETNQRWGALDVLGYFVHKYEEHNATEYVFINITNPFKSKETKFCAQLVYVLKSKELLKNYIDWIFDIKSKSGFKVFGVAILVQGWLINEFQCSKKAQIKKEITRTTKLPDTYREWCKNNIPELFENYELETYGNLKTLLGMVNSNYAESCIISAVDKAKELGIIKGGKQ